MPPARLGDNQPVPRATCWKGWKKGASLTVINRAATCRWYTVTKTAEQFAFGCLYIPLHPDAPFFRRFVAEIFRPTTPLTCRRRFGRPSGSAHGSAQPATTQPPRQLIAKDLPLRLAKFRSSGRHTRSLRGQKTGRLPGTAVRLPEEPNGNPAAS